MNTVLQRVLRLKDHHIQTWRDQPDSFWLAHMMQEMGELASSLVDDHEHSPDHELEQITSMALNWLEKRNDDHS